MKTQRLPVALELSPAQYYAASHAQRDLTWLKRWMWVYFVLLIFEGAMRKWGIASLSKPLLLIRDPVVLAIYFQAIRCRKFSMKTMWPFASLAAVLILLACGQMAAGIVSLPIAVFGLQAYLLHLPLILVMAETLDAEDLRAFGRWTMLLSLPMALLVVQQYRSPGSAWVNAGVGKEVWAGQILAARGHIRPAGTFSFSVGMQSFALLVAIFALEDVTSKRNGHPRWLVLSSLLITVAFIPLLGSRTLLFSMAALGCLVLLSGVSHVARLGGMVKMVAIVLLLSLVAIQVPLFNDAVETFKVRWQSATDAEGGSVLEVLNTRLLGPIKSTLDAADEVPLIGLGIGAGSNFASISITGTAAFAMGEGEWSRLVAEMGPLVGLLYLGMRFALALYIILQAREALARHALLAWLLLALVVPCLLLNTLEQATELGFVAFGCGLCLAAARVNGKAGRSNAAALSRR